MTWTDCLGAALAGAAFAAKCDEYKHEARRCRRIARGVLESADTNGVVLEFFTEKRIHKHRDPGFGIICCAPGLDENNLGPALQIAIREWLTHMGMGGDAVSVGKLTITGTGGDK